VRVPGGPRLVGEGQKTAAKSEVASASPVGKKAVMPDPNEAFGQDVKKEPPDELSGRKAHYAVCAAAPVIFVAEGDVAVLEREDAPV
jgi:hypothetical protein